MAAGTFTGRLAASSTQIRTGSRSVGQWKLRLSLPDPLAAGTIRRHS